MLTLGNAEERDWMDKSGFCEESLILEFYKKGFLSVKVQGPFFVAKI